MINFSTDLIKRFLEETRYMDFSNKQIKDIVIGNGSISYIIVSMHDDIIKYDTDFISFFEIMGWFLNKIELKK